ncbi:MAG: hypothetical protein UV38_C0003G0155 [candidate division TM6 bacterium GW2011_GWE2_42_60]|nr:MAG: hypothetical protein UV38_C0003G0155 [candidate division TM6 bacterium GW2011_GWE2_42_60]HBY05368.1 hypothetical protein [Candidatus Dependentiae bacterium]
MKKSLATRILTTSLAIFAMLFGAGNLIFPLRIGVQSGGHVFIGFFGFALTGILLPVLGLMAIVTFQGNYEAFFGRLGKWLGGISIFLSMMILGPLIAMPRIMSLSYEMLKAFLPGVPLYVFTAFFAFLAFLTTYRMSRLLDIIGKYLSPAKVISIVTVIVAGLVTSHYAGTQPIDKGTFFWESLIRGYGTLDLIGAIFFGSIVVRLLAEYSGKSEAIDIQKAVKITGTSGLFAGLLLGIVYLGITCLGAFHGSGLAHLNEGEIFSTIAYTILGNLGAAIIGLVVFLAGLTTMVSITAVVGEYITRISRQKVSYSVAVGSVLTLCAIVASSGLSALIAYTTPFINFFYPTIITLTVCNILYKVYGFSWVKIPVVLTALFSAWFILVPLFW